MNFYKRLLCIILCSSIVFSMTGCTKADPAPAQTEQVQAEETLSIMDSYLTVAERFIDAEEFDSAIAVLEQATELAEDARITEMLARIETLRSVPLDVVVREEP